MSRNYHRVLWPFECILSRRNWRKFNRVAKRREAKLKAMINKPPGHSAGRLGSC
jgi:hypothetical protein